MEKYVDLHIHSLYSDGTLTPAEILAVAVGSGVGTISITDHNALDGTIELMELASGRNDIRCFSGVELDAMSDGVNYHVLGYRFDIDDKVFAARVGENRAWLESVNRRVIKRMSQDHVQLSLDEYEGFSYDRRLGGWSALHYLLAKGLATDPLEAFKLYASYKPQYEAAGFPDISVVAKWIHEAGGVTILAHPGKVIRVDTLEQFSMRLNQTVAYGLDGIECYYPLHSTEITKACLDLCRTSGLYVTSGCDCHGDFLLETRCIGETKITEKLLGRNVFW